MQAGLNLTNAIGETLEVVSQTALEQTGTVYNIQVHEHNTYHVGEMGVWVHNADCCKVGKIDDIFTLVAVDPSSRAVFSRSKIYENGIGVKLDDTQVKLLELIADAKSSTAKGVKSVLGN